MKPTIVAFSLLAVVSLMGCSQNAELERARTEADAAKAELAKVKAEADAARTELALLKAQLADLAGKPGKSPSLAEEAVQKVAQEFFDDLLTGRFVSAYQTMSDAYQKRVERRAFDLFIDKHSALKVGGTRINGVAPLYKVRKVAKDNSYECDYATMKLSTPDRAINITLRLIEEEGRWKVDEFLEVKESKW